MAAFNYLELARDEGLETSISQEDGSGSCTYQLQGANAATPPTVRQLSDFVPFLIGTVNNLKKKVVRKDGNADAGKVRRTLPKLHPFIPTLTAAGVRSIKGEGTASAGTSVQILGLDPISTQFTHYTHYNYKIEFKKRPYFLVPDSQIVVTTSGAQPYYPPGSTGPGSAKAYYYANEWVRYTSRTQAPTADTVSATTGQMVLRTASGSDPNNWNFQGTTYQDLQNHIIEFTWYLVPYRYFLPHTEGGVTYKPYLTRFKNCVNQYEWNGYPRGSLLYLGATPQIFIPEVPAVTRFLGISVAQSQDLLCNVKLRFLYTTREGTDVPNDDAGAGPVDAMFTDRNNVPAGHNLQPNFVTRLFYYATTEDPTAPADHTKWRASFPSFPFQLLFTDPLLVQPAGVI